MGEAPLACIIKHESGQNLVFFFAHVHGMEKNTNAMFFFFFSCFLVFFVFTYKAEYLSIADWTSRR